MILITEIQLNTQTLTASMNIYKLSERTIQSEGDNYNPAINLTYTKKGKQAGEQFRIIAGANFSLNKNDRIFYQQYF